MGGKLPEGVLDGVPVRIHSRQHQVQGFSLG